MLKSLSFYKLTIIRLTVLQAWCRASLLGPTYQRSGQSIGCWSGGSQEKHRRDIRACQIAGHHRSPPAPQHPPMTQALPQSWKEKIYISVRYFRHVDRYLVHQSTHVWVGKYNCNMWWQQSLTMSLGGWNSCNSYIIIMETVSKPF